MRRPLDEQRIVNTASGYNFAAWIALTLTWLLFLLGTALAGLVLIMAIFVAVLGLPRCIQTLRGKFIFVPLMSLACFVLCGVIAATVPDTSSMSARMLMVLCGLTTSALTAPVIWSIARHDFAKAVPAWSCRGCGYTLIGLSGRRCPECGEPFDADKVPSVGSLKD